MARSCWDTGLGERCVATDPVGRGKPDDLGVLGLDGFRERGLHGDAHTAYAVRCSTSVSISLRLSSTLSATTTSPAHGRRRARKPTEEILDFPRPVSNDDVSPAKQKDPEKHSRRHTPV
jgi:hypothetical protein